MAKIGRPGLSREKRADLWARWKSGQCASDIARALERTKGAIHHVLAFNGGIAPVARRLTGVGFAMIVNRNEHDQAVGGPGKRLSMRSPARTSTATCMLVLPV
jgi:hypothetical protein